MLLLHWPSRQAHFRCQTAVLLSCASIDREVGTRPTVKRAKFWRGLTKVLALFTVSRVPGQPNLRSGSFVASVLEAYGERAAEVEEANNW